MADPDIPLVLVVDNEALDREFGGMVLGAAGWRVASVPGGREAMTLLEQLPPPMLMDAHMVGISGVETVAAIHRRADRAADVAILADTTTPQGAPGILQARLRQVRPQAVHRR